MHKNNPALRTKKQMSEDKLASQQIPDRVPGKDKEQWKGSKTLKKLCLKHVQINWKH